VTVYRGCHVPTDRGFDVGRDLWARFEDDVVRLGLTDVAQTRMGKMVSIRFKRVGRRIKPGGSVATVESAKWVGPVPCPFGAEVVANNDDAYNADILIANRDPYEAGWVSVVKPDDVAEARTHFLEGEAAVATYMERIDILDISCFRCAD
jgi:glycine cleavage system H protein